MTAATQVIQDSAANIAGVLVEVLPYIQRFKGKIVVVKVGGSALANPEVADHFATDIALMHMVGIHPVVVHGGGPQITAMMTRLGKKATFKSGHRVTDLESLDIARMVLVGNINRDIVVRINRHGPIALGVSGEDADLLIATERDPDLGFVGDVTAVNSDLVRRLLTQGLVPVIATVGSDGFGQAYNINADAGAAAIAAELGALKLVYLTDVDGLYRDPADPASLISTTNQEGLFRMLSSGSVSSGMIPKLEGCISALARGVPSTHILGTATPHALLIELFTNAGIGTMASGGS